MQEDSYHVRQSQQIYQYEFFSDGPKGRIRKVIQFQSIGNIGLFYNLAFGDWDEKGGMIHDSVKSNNGDRQKLLTTVAQTVFKFVENNPNVTIVAQGSTPARTRLYQMGIASFWDEIKEHFEIDGLIGDRWEHFATKRNYTAF